MTGKTILCVLAASILATSTPGFAQGNPDHGRQQRRDRQEQRNERQDRRHDQGRRAWQEHDQRGRQQQERRDERGAGPEHRLHRGDRLPPEYRHRHYVVEDWRGHRLSPPPRGYHWVQVGGDYVLVAIATGVILQILLGN